MTSSGLLTMSRKELDRAEWMLRVHEKRMTQAKAAERLGLSVRQVERLYCAYKAGGAAALVSKKRGQPQAKGRVERANHLTLQDRLVKGEGERDRASARVASDLPAIDTRSAPVSPHAASSKPLAPLGTTSP